MSYGWKPYVPVTKKRALAARALEKLSKKKGLIMQPVVIAGRKIADSFWGKGWCDHMESFSDYSNRLPRGRTYVRNGSVCHLDIQQGTIKAIVSGSKLYNIAITISPLPNKKWVAVKSACSGRIGSLIDLLRGKLASGVMELVCHRESGLFPLPGEITFTCDCPDWASMCKHVAAVLYGVGARLDHSPEKLFILRGVNHEELVDVSSVVREAAGAGTSRRRIAATGLSDVFGIELVEPGEVGVSSARKGAVAGNNKSPEDKPKKVTTAKSAKVAKPVMAVAKSVQNAIMQQSPPFPKRLSGAAILRWRNSLGETQSEFAGRIGVSAGCISQWERKGRQTPHVRESTVAALQKAWELTKS